MRLWSLHPRYLDRQGLLALWREGLLAQKVLQGATRGYRHHPQLDRFRGQPDPLAAIGAYLRGVLEEAQRRGYAFDGGRILSAAPVVPFTVTRGQLACEWRHLLRKLQARDPAAYARCVRVQRVRSHPSLRVVPGPVEPWERAEQSSRRSGP